jgi:hypothetical protein
MDGLLLAPEALLLATQKPQDQPAAAAHRRSAEPKSDQRSAGRIVGLLVDWEFAEFVAQEFNMASSSS